MMDGFRAYKFYLALKLHFTSSKFDVFVNKGRVKASLDKFLLRNDHALFDRVGRQFSEDKDYIQFIASNFMYNNPNMMYQMDVAQANYKEFLRRKQSITHVFADDLATMIKLGADYGNNSCQKIPDVVQLLMSGKITLETLVILDALDGVVEQLQQNNHMSLLLGDDLLRIRKARGFVKFDPYKIMTPYTDFLEELRGQARG